jgi:tRNA(fMet)-specific endonuclease VapC
MKRYVLDTGSAADWIHRRGLIRERSQQAVQAGGRIGICTPVLGELWAGVEFSQTRERNRHRLIRALAELIVWPYDNAAAEEYGRIYAALRRLGRPMQQIDIQIAAVALSLGHCTAVSKDSDLAAVPGLAVENWTAE